MQILFTFLCIFIHFGVLFGGVFQGCFGVFGGGVRWGVRGVRCSVGVAAYLQKCERYTRPAKAVSEAEGVTYG